MSDAKKDAKFSLKVMVNKEKTKVLFAQVDSSFADVLLSFLTLPLGTIVRILKKHYGSEEPAIGSVSSLYNGLANLDSVNFWTEDAKSSLLHPQSSSDAQCKSLMLDISDSQPLEVITSPSVTYHTYHHHHGMHESPPPSLFYYAVPVTEETSESAPCDDGVFTKSTASFVISDDLQMLSATKGLLQIAVSLGITDVDKAEQMTVTFGFAEVMDLLKASLISSTPLSDIILNKTRLVKPTKNKLKQEISLPDPTENESAPNSKNMILRVTLQKFTNKFVYAQAQEDFAEFLFTLLIVPLGGVECLLAGNSLSKCMDSLYKSVSDHIENMYFNTPEAKDRLIKPKIPRGYISKNYTLPLIEEELASSPGVFSSKTKFPNGQGSYLKIPKTFMVTDDLTVTPLCIASTVSILKSLNISLSDVKEVELKIGFKEALGILRASLTSNCALSDGLNLRNHLSSQKKPKQEC